MNPVLYMCVVSQHTSTSQQVTVLNALSEFSSFIYIHLGFLIVFDTFLLGLPSQLCSSVWVF